MPTGRNSLTPNPIAFGKARFKLGIAAAISCLGVVGVCVADTEVPVDIIGRVLFVNAHVNGEGPFNFILDTGASETVIIPRLAKKLGVSSFPVSSCQRRGRVQSVAVGKATVEDLPVYVYDPPQALPLRLDKGIDYHGLLGYTFLRHFVTTVDYPKQRVRLRLPSRPPPAGTESTGKEERIPFTLLEQLIYVRGSVNGKGPVTFLLDTGSAEVLLWPSVAERLNLTTRAMPQYGHTALARLARLGLGQAMVGNVPAIVRPAPAKPPSNRYHGILGYPYLSKFVVTVDYGSRVIMLERGPSPSVNLRTFELKHPQALPAYPLERPAHLPLTPEP